MRLNHFLPFRKKAERGPLRRSLKRLGPTWLAAPLRRIIQATCLIAFLWLFCYVCWPYTARPARTWGGWLPAEVDAETGRVTATNEQPPAEPIAAGAVLHVVDTGSGNGQYLGPFRVATAGDVELRLQPSEKLEAEQLDRLLMSFGPWLLRETEPGSWPSHYADELAAKETIAAETFLAIDPLVSLSTALAAKAWVWSLSCAGVILAICLIVPRGFCGYVCPLGTLIDVCDWALFGRAKWSRVTVDGWWLRTKYYLLAATLAASLLGVLISGFVAAIPVVTRGMAFVLTPLQLGATRGWHQVPPLGAGHYVSIALLLAVLGLGLLRPRFWCKYVCPTGAVFSIANLLRLTERKVDAECIGCKQCTEVCPFDAIEPDFTTRAGDCTFCQTCGGACPTGAITFAPRWSRLESKPADAPPADEATTGRRGFLAATIGVVAGTAGGASAAAAIHGGTRRDDSGTSVPVRPPGSVPESQFLQLCIRCGECYQACPNSVLQPQGIAHGLEGLWTPHVVAQWSGCEPSCSNCGRVCPTGAIRALPLEEKRAARMALAVINKRTCLPYAGRDECQLCVDECAAAGYDAIEFVRVGTKADQAGNPIEGTGRLAPVVLPEACIGCGLCQTRCHAVNVKQKHLLGQTAVRIEAGEGKEDRLTGGSYIERRQQRRRKRRADSPGSAGPGRQGDGYLPDSLD